MELLAQLLSALIFVFVPILFGWIVAHHWLAWRDPLASSGTAVVLGAASYLVTAHSLSYVLPFSSACMAALIVLAVIAALALIHIRLNGGQVIAPFEVFDRRILWVYAALIAVFGFMNARFIGSDPWSWQHFPLASTILSGNFPVMSPINPDQQLFYHYAPAFLAAAFSAVSGLSLAVGFALQPLVGCAGVLLCSGAIVWRLLKSERAALLCSLLALMGAGLVWMKGGMTLLSDLLAVMRGMPVAAPFRGIADMTGSAITTSILNFIGHRSTATGFPLLFGLLLFALCFLGEEHPRRRSLILSAGFVLALALTLTMEIAFATAMVVLIGMGLLFMIFPMHRMAGRRLLQFGLIVFLPALLIALFHGGVFSGLLETASEPSFQFHPDVRVLYDTYGSSSGFWQWPFLGGFGFTLLLFPVSLVFAWRKRGEQPFWLVLCALGALHLLIPFMVRYLLIEGEMRRVFYAATSIFALLAGAWIWQWLLVPSSAARRVLGSILIASMLISSTVYVLLRITFPTMRFEYSPVFAGIPQVSEQRQKMYAWVQQHTTLADNFYLRNLTVDFRTVPDEVAQMQDRVLFTTYTGRFTVGPIIYWSYPKDWLETVLRAETTCNADAFSALHVRYLVVEDQEREDWFSRLCDEREWKVRYDDGQPGRPYPRILELAAR